jgi:uncharacterized protein YfdQ (DUF2303 family)
VNDHNDNIGIEGSAFAALPQEHTHLDASTIATIGALSLAASAVQETGGTTHLVVPEGYKHIDLTGLIEKAGAAPRRKQGAVQLSEIASFNTYVTDQGDPATTYVYADPEARTLTAVINDHHRSAPVAGWRDLRAVYKAELSREFTAWLANNKAPKEQEEFAIFIEDNIADVIEPSGDTLLQIALTLQAKTEVNFNSSKRLDNGQVQFTYSETIDARAGVGSIEIPREFTIGVRLFKNGEAYRVRARLKYRLNGGKLKFWYELDRPENAVEDAFEAYINQARAAGFTVLLGKP